MKKLILSITLSLILTSTLYANEVQMEETCSLFTNLAGIIMKNRQEGIELSTTMSVLLKQDIGEGAREIISGIIVDAYEIPYYYTEENKQLAISKHKNKVYLECYKAFLKSKEID